MMGWPRLCFEPHRVTGWSLMGWPLLGPSLLNLSFRVCLPFRASLLFISPFIFIMRSKLQDTKDWYWPRGLYCLFIPSPQSQQHLGITCPCPQPTDGMFWLSQWSSTLELLGLSQSLEALGPWPTSCLQGDQLVWAGSCRASLVIQLQLSSQETWHRILWQKHKSQWVWVFKKENEKASHKLEEGICNSYSELHPEYIKNFCEL